MNIQIQESKNNSDFLQVKDVNLSGDINTLICGTATFCNIEQLVVVNSPNRFLLGVLRQGGPVGYVSLSKEGFSEQNTADILNWFRTHNVEIIENKEG